MLQDITGEQGEYLLTLHDILHSRGYSVYHGKIFLKFGASGNKEMNEVHRLVLASRKLNTR